MTTIGKNKVLKKLINYKQTCVVCFVVAGGVLPEPLQDFCNAAKYLFIFFPQGKCLKTYKLRIVSNVISSD